MNHNSKEMIYKSFEIIITWYEYILNDSMNQGELLLSSYHLFNESSL